VVDEGNEAVKEDFPVDEDWTTEVAAEVVPVEVTEEDALTAAVVTTAELGLVVDEEPAKAVDEATETVAEDEAAETEVDEPATEADEADAEDEPAKEVAAVTAEADVVDEVAKIVDPAELVVVAISDDTDEDAPEEMHWTWVP